MVGPRGRSFVLLLLLLIIHHSPNSPKLGSGQDGPEQHTLRCPPKIRREVVKVFAYIVNFCKFISSSRDASCPQDPSTACCWINATLADHRANLTHPASSERRRGRAEIAFYFPMLGLGEKILHASFGTQFSTSHSGRIASSSLLVNLEL